jgi:chromosome segregation ATPase
MCISLLFIGGCRVNWPLVFSKAEPQPSAEEVRQYRQAITAYQKTAYREAAQSFELLRMQTRDKRFARMALYGLACSKLMAADTPEAYADALQLWQKWVEKAPRKVDYENPALADALIKEKMLFSNIPLKKAEAEEAAEEPMVSRWLLIQSKVELDRLRGELKAARKTLDKRQKLIKDRERKIGELKRKIKALETIDQKIQKKKDAIPSADTP